MTYTAALLASDLVRTGRILVPVAVRPAPRSAYASPWSRAERHDPGRAANNIARLKRIEQACESGRRCDRPRDAYVDDGASL